MAITLRAARVFHAWGIDPAVKAFYELCTSPESNETMLQFMEKAVTGSFTNHGWRIRYYWNKELDQKMPIIITPDGLEMRFPFTDEM